MKDDGSIDRFNNEWPTIATILANLIDEVTELKSKVKLLQDRSKPFKPPTEDDVICYLDELYEKGHKEYKDFNYKKWFAFYESKNWMVGKSKMKDWKAAIRNAKSWCIEEEEKMF